MSPARTSTLATVATVVAAAALLALLTWAAATGPEQVLRAPGDPRNETVEQTGAQPESGLSRLQRLQREHRAPVGPPPAWVRVLGTALEALVLAVVAYGLWRAVGRLLARWRDRERSPPRHPEPDDLNVLDAGPLLEQALEADAAAQESALDRGEPRNAIVACWHRFETTAETAGVRRRSWQTPSEFVLQVLDAAGADPGPVTRLAELYREARFSDHPLSEEHRRAALEALRATHASLRRPVGSGGAR